MALAKLRNTVPGAGKSDDRRVLQARLQIVVDSLMATAIFNPLFACTGALVLGAPHSPFGPVPLWRLLTALGGQLAASAIAWLLYRRYRQIPLAAVGKVQALLLLSQVLFSAMWGAIAFLYWVPGNEINHVYVVTVMSVVAFSVVFARSVHMRILLVAIFVQCGLFFIRVITDPSATTHIIVPIVPVYILYLLSMGRSSHQRISALIEARFANEDLATALRQARDEALQKRYEAETASQSKTAFLANMSHELRTPLNAILGFSDIIAHQSMGRDQVDRYSDYARDIHSSGSHLLSLINDLLDIAKIEAGRMEIDRRMVDPRAVVDGVIRLMAPRAQAKGQSLAVDIDADVPLVTADERAFRQMLLNLLSNAIKFTPEGGEISIACHATDEGGLELCVSDNGPGIAAEKLSQVFEPFSQIDNRFDREAGGTGLGLALVQGLIRLHGGRTWLESKPGDGVKAHIYFPSTITGAATERATA